MDISIHLGAHKTASTHLQQSLMRARPHLVVNGCAYFGPNALRDKLRLPPLSPGAPARPDLVAKLTETLRKHDSADRRILMSDENILGTTRADLIAQRDQLYPGSAARLERLLELLDLGDVTLFMALRMPLGFVTSAYGQQLNAGLLVEFAEYTAGFAPQALRWSELVARLLGVNRVKHIVLWRYEDYPAVTPQLLQAMVGPAAARHVKPVQGQSLVGTSARAIDVARARLASDPSLDPRRTILEARAEFPKTTDMPGPAPFGPQALTRADADYDQDWARLERMAGVSRLLPDHGALRAKQG